jgi:cellobiose-specific phosphotransferase system component IIB
MFGNGPQLKMLLEKLENKTTEPKEIKIRNFSPPNFWILNNSKEIL